MQLTSVRALAAALVLGAAGAAVMAPAPALAAKEKKAKEAAPQLTPAVQKLLLDTQNAIKANDLATALAKVNEAKAGAQTPDDKLFVGQLRLQIATKQNDEALRNAAYLELYESGKLTPEQEAQVVRNLGVTAYNGRDMANAVKYFGRATELQPNDATNWALLADSKRNTKDFAGAIAAIDKAITLQQASGQKVDESWYRKAFAFAYEAKDKPATLKYAKAYVTAFPSKSAWRDALITYRNDNPLDDEQSLDLWRLARANNALQGERDFYDYAMAANDRGLPGETDVVIAEGIAAKQIDPAHKALGPLKANAASKIAADKASLAASEKSAVASGDVRRIVGIGNAYLSYGNYTKAEELYNVALAKPGADADLINTRIGIAQAMQKKKAEALASFAKVNGQRKPIADFWTIYLNQQA